MQLGSCFNDSEDSSGDETQFSRGRRPIRRRPTCPLNLRDVLPQCDSSSEEIEPSDSPPSLLRPTPTFFDFTHNTAFHSRRPNDTLSSFTSPDIPGTNGDSSLFPSASSNSWLTSQNASGRIRQAGDKEQPPGTSTANYTKPPTSRAGGNSFPKLSSRSKETPESKHRKAALEKFRKKLQDTEIGSDWATGSAWQSEQTATDTPSPDDTNPPESSKPPTIPGPFQPQPLKTSELQPTKLEPQITKALEPQITNPLEPKPTKALEPQITKALEPQITKALELQPTKALEPQITKALEPQITKALELQPTKALEPQITKALEPQPTKALEPQPTKALEPKTLSTKSSKSLRPSATSVQSKRLKETIASKLLSKRPKKYAILPKGSRHTVTVFHSPSQPTDSVGSFGSFASDNDPLDTKRPSSTSLSNSSEEGDEPILPPLPPLPAPITADWRQNKTLQRFQTALNSARGPVSNLYTRTVRQLTEGNAKLLPEGFADGVDISSDETKDNWSVEDDEFDSEWLEWLAQTSIQNEEEGEEGEREEEGEDTKTLKSSRRSTKPRVAGLRRVTGFFYPLKYLVEMLPVYKALSYLGGFPLEIDTSDEIPRYSYNNKSWRHFLFIGTSLLSFLTAILMIANVYKISTAVDPLTVHETATRLELDKYWIEATLEILSLLFLALSSVSMLEYGGGTSIVDFLNRWSTVLALIRYDVTSGLKNICTAFFCCYGIYAGTIVLLFFVGGEGVPTVRGSCGFNGLLILNSFTDQLRFRPSYRVVEFLGLFVHLYTTLASSLVPLLICMYCWTLDNAAKRFNERLAGCLRSVGFMKASQAYPKIFEEHLMVTSFPRQIGKVFRLTLIAYLACKMVEMTVTLFGVAEPIVNGFPESDQKFLNLTAQSSFDPEKTIPIQVVEPSWVQALKSGLYVAKTWIPWLIFMEIVQKPGSSLMRGAGLIVRNFLSHSKSSHALRFITSMEFSFSSRIVFHVNPGMQLTREFTGKFVAFVLVLTVLLLEFIPSAVNPQGFESCDHFGRCSLFRFSPKSKARDGFGDSIGKVISEKLHATTQRPLPPLRLLPNVVLTYPPCLATGRLPQENHTHTFKCQEDLSDPVYIPTYFRRSSDGNFIQVPPTPDHSCVQSSSITKGETLFDCFGDKVSPLEADECGNPKLPTPDATGAKKLPILRAVRLNHEIFCCFVYSGLENQAERCNLLSTPTHSCSRKSKAPGRKTHEESIVQMWTKSSKAVVDNQLPLWTGCLCQGLEGFPVSSTACTVPPTTTTTTTPHKPTTPSIPTTTPRYKPDGPCPSATHPIGACSACPDPRSLFRTHFLSSCPLPGGGIFAIPSVVDLLSTGGVYPFSYPCTQQYSVLYVNWLNAPHDCYGSRAVVLNGGTVDDCGTIGVGYPSRYDGKEVTFPEIRAVRLPEGGPYPPDGTQFQYLCCWDYKEWQDVNSTCNTYPGSYLSRVCAFRTTYSVQHAEDVCRYVGRTGLNPHYRDKCLGVNFCRNY